MTVGSLEDVSMPPLTEALRRMGPAFILAAATLGPGTITVYSLSGSLFGYQLLWVFVLAGVFAVVYVEMLARFGIVSDRTLWGAIREKYGPAAAILGGVFGGATALGFQTGNVVGVGLGLSVLTGVDSVLWGTVMAAAAIGFIWVRDLYDRLEALVFALIVVMIAGFVGTLAITGFSVSGAAAGLVPSIPSGQAVLITLVMMATYFSLYGVVYQAYLVKEKGYGREDLGAATFDAIAAMVVLGLLGAIILLTSAAVLKPQGIVVDSAAAMARQLRPLAGDAATLLFGVGLVAASFSSLVANALIGGVLLADGLDYSAAFDGLPVKVIATAITAVGWITGIAPQLFGADPVDTIVLAQAFSVVALPYFGLVALLLLNDSEYVGRFTNTRARNVLAAVGYVVTLAIALNFVRSLL